MDSGEANKKGSVDSETGTAGKGTLFAESMQLSFWTSKLKDGDGNDATQE